MPIMSRYRITLLADVDDEALAEHVETTKGETPPYTTDPCEWDGSDWFRANDEGIIDAYEVELLSANRIKTDDE